MKTLTQEEVKKLKLDKISVITEDMLEGYESIKWDAFQYCMSLTSIIIPNNVKIIEKYAFQGCKRLTSVTIPNSIKTIEPGTFTSCTSLTSITIPDSVISIGNYAFHNCFSLREVIIPNSVTSIGEYAFYWCPSLPSVTIPNSVTYIGTEAFRGCSSLTSINVDSNNPNYSSVDGVLFNKDKTTLIAYPGGKQGAYIIPDSVTWIIDYAFQNCCSLTSLIIGNNVVSIGEYTFKNCTSLITVIISNSVINIRYGAFSECSSLTSVTIPNGVTKIGAFAFEDCTSLISINIPNSVTSIGEFAFVGCDSLKSITIGDKTYAQQTIIDGKCKAYKGFKPDLTCRDYQYKAGETFIMDEPIEICRQGFHACLNLKDVFSYYSGKIEKDFIVHEVELENVQAGDEITGDSKVVANKITIGKRIL